MPAKYRFRMYERLASEAPAILEEVRIAATELGLLDGRKNVNPPGADSLPRPNLASEPQDPRETVNRMREVVKGSLGDSLDCCPVSSPAAALWLVRAVALGGTSGRRALELPWRCLMPRQKCLGLLAGADPFPPKYQSLVVGFRSGGPTSDLPASPLASPSFQPVVVPLEGATYACHGPTSSPVSLLAAVRPVPSLEVIATTAETHAPYLAGFIVQGASTPGCGFGERDEKGIHALEKGLSEMAAEFDVPLIIDESFGLPFLSPDPGGSCSRATVFGHPALGGLGLVIGTEDLVVPMLKELGYIPGPAGLSGAVGSPPALLPSPSGLSPVLDLLADLSASPERYRRALDHLGGLVTEELDALARDFKEKLRVRKETGSLSVEINYEDTWEGQLGFPIFSTVDTERGLNLMELGRAAMGITMASVLEASITASLPSDGPGSFALDEERARLELQGLVRLMEIMGKRSGFLT